MELDELIDKLDENLASKEKTKEQKDAERLAEEARVKAETEKAQADKAEADRVAEEARLTQEEADKKKAAEEGDEGGEGEKKSFIELMEQGVSPEDAAKAEADKKAAEVVIPDEIKAKLEKLALLENDPLHQAVSLGATRDELLQIAAEIKGKDYSKVTFEELIRMEIARETGLEGDDLAAEVALAVGDFESKSLYQRSTEEKALRAKFQAESNKGESPTLKTLEAAYHAKMEGVQTPEQIKQAIDLTIKAEVSQITEVGKKFIGTVLNGVEFTEADLKAAVDSYDPDTIVKYLDKDSKLNAAQFIYDEFRLKNFDKMLEKGIELALKKANKENKVTDRSLGKGGVTENGEVDPKKQLLTEFGMPDYVVNKVK